MDCLFILGTQLFCLYFFFMVEAYQLSPGPKTVSSKNHVTYVRM